MSETKPSVRLSKYVIPQRYRIMIKPDLDNFTFSGEETIYFVLKRSTNKITLHSADLKIDTADIVANTSKQKDNWAAKISYDDKAETVTLSFPKAISSGKHQMKLSFTGILNDQLRGFYRSSYKYKGTTKHLGISQFEATDARRAFPCFDEPAQKAIFDVTLMIPRHLTAISNTIETEISDHDEGYKVVKFAPTPKMSTYLLAFIVGDLEFIEGKTKDGVLVRIFTTPGKKHQAKFALEVGIKALEFYNRYFDIPYPLPVLDMIAVPDFAAGAMENWGAITYRETALLVDEKHTPLANRQYVAHVIAHELTHQWFGNLVTMEWWTHLWLNEGFATYMSYVAVDHLFPKWQMWTQFVSQDLGNALKLDSLQTTHPIEIDVHHPDEIGEIFDAVSYDKGASVIRMLADYLGETSFRDGLRYYLKKHSYKNTSTVHLWEAFEKISKKPVREIMRIWTRKPGFPVIKVEDQGDALALKQSRFFSSVVTKKQTSDNTVWPIPVKYSADGARPQYFMLAKKQDKLPLKGDREYLKFNKGEVGFYVTHYEPQLLEALQQPIRNKQLHQDDRMGVIRDSFSLAEAGEMSAAEALKIAQAYKGERSYNVWVEVLTGLAEVDVLLQGQPFKQRYHRFVLHLLGEIKKEIDWKPKVGESDNITLLRSLLLGALGQYGDRASLKQAVQLFRKTKKMDKIHPDVRAAVYYLTAQAGTRKDYARLRKLYEETDIHEEKNRLARALTLFRDPVLIKRTLKFLFSKDVRLQDGPFLMIYAWRNPAAWPHIWQFMQNNWDMLIKRYGQGGRMIGYMIKPLHHFSDPKTVLQVDRFLKTHKAPGAAMAVKQTLERIHSRADWRKRDLKNIEKFLSRYNY